MSRRRLLVLALVIVGLGLGVVLQLSPSPAGSTPDLAARALTGVSINVSDMDRSVDFYSRALFFKKVSDVEASGPGGHARVVTMSLGAERIELVQHLAAPGRPVPADSRSNDRWFQHIAIVVSDMDQAYLWLRQHRVAHTSPAPQRLPDWNSNAGGIRAFYFKDPDGHALEIVQFPAGKGDGRWQRPADRVFLGIDHTAIVVADTESSLAFYRDRLGMRVVGASENHGPEQEKLNDVAGARLRITTLRAAAGPGVELLEYLAPRDGRAFPRDVAANDLIRWQTLVLTYDAAAAPAKRGPSRDTSPIRKAVVVLDPDGHAVQLRTF